MIEIPWPKFAPEFTGLKVSAHDGLAEVTCHGATFGWVELHPDAPIDFGVVLSDWLYYCLPDTVGGDRWPEGWEHRGGLHEYEVGTGVVQLSECGMGVVRVGGFGAPLSGTLAQQVEQAKHVVAYVNARKEAEDNQ